MGLETLYWSVPKISNIVRLSNLDNEISSAKIVFSINWFSRSSGIISWWFTIAYFGRWRLMVRRYHLLHREKTKKDFCEQFMPCPCVKQRIGKFKLKLPLTFAGVLDRVFYFCFKERYLSSILCLVAFEACLFWWTLHQPRLDVKLRKHRWYRRSLILDLLSESLLDPVSEKFLGKLMFFRFEALCS